MSKVTVTKISSGHEVSFPPCIRVSDLTHAIKTRAYELFQARGGEPGDALEDWIRAERGMIGHARANLVEDETGYSADFRLPGFEPEAIDVAISPEQVGIHAHRGIHSDLSPDSQNVLHEFSEGEAYRQLFFPNPVDPDSAEARVEDGVLHVTVEKSGAQRQENLPK